MGPGIQEWIHKFEEGAGAQYIRAFFATLLLCGLATLWHLRESRNFTAIEAMDAAQLARNIAQGQGYTTDFVRPISMAMVESRQGPGMFMLKEGHPDLANAPVYPALLAGLMKALPFDWTVKQTGFTRYQPELLINALNQVLFFAVIFLVFRLARKLFDPGVAWVSAILLALTEVFWEFTTSGLSTMLLMVLFLGLLNLLLRIEMFNRAEQPARGRQIILCAVGGLVIAVMCLTRYSYGWLIIPAAAFVAVYCAGIRIPGTVAMVITFLLCVAPWAARNYQQSGYLFGTATLAIHEGTLSFPTTRLPRILPRNISGELNKVGVEEYTRKLVTNAKKILSDELPRSGGNWILAFFLAGLLVPFLNPALNRLRLFLLASVAGLVVVQALGVTELSVFSPLVNSENLLVVLMPALFIFAVAFFFILLDQVQFPMPILRNAAVIGVIMLLGLPLIFRVLPPREFPVAYPPYFPPVIQQVSHWLRPDELMMADMPWAVAWYGDRQAVWNTMDVGAKKGDDFYRINDFGKLIKGLYLTPVTTNMRFLNEMRQSPEGVWGKFYLDVVVLKNLPVGFPLQTGPPGLLPDQLFLSDYVRWNE